MIAAKSLSGVGLRDRQVAEQERVAVAELVGILASVVHADRDLHAHRLRRLVVSPQPAPDRSGDHGQHDVVDRHAAAGGVLDPLQVVQLAGGERDLAVAADATIERRLGAQRPELAPQGGGERGQLAAASRQRRGEAAARAPLASAPPTLRSRLPAPEASRRAVPGAGSGSPRRGRRGLARRRRCPRGAGRASAGR